MNATTLLSEERPSGIGKTRYANIGRIYSDLGLTEDEKVELDAIVDKVVPANQNLFAISRRGAARKAAIRASILTLDRLIVEPMSDALFAKLASPEYIRISGYALYSLVLGKWQDAARARNAAVRECGISYIEGVGGTKDISL
ncbi:hypothetical protein ABW19_dt0208615 [Dactylella cylindrospora]|nr:hypothetical protein ABW19_dt0208615 [Dactylella cylindrospora]